MSGRYRFFYGEFIDFGQEVFKVIAKLGRAVDKPYELLNRTFTVIYTNRKDYKAGAKVKLSKRVPDNIQLYETADDCIGDHFEKFL